MACEQDAIWFSYLESKGLLNPDDPAAVEALFAAFPVQPLPVQDELADTQPREPVASVSANAAKNSFSCDDPTAG